MGMRINTNILALKAQRNLLRSNKALSRAMERLASGSRINSAGDDAAGLAVSEGLRSQVRGLQQAIRNANDGVGFLNTAEGALGEQTSIAQRIRELAIQAANGAISDADRVNLNREAQQLIEEFDRIATSTEFNGVFLLDGTFQTTDLQVGTRKGQKVSFSIGDARSSSLGSLATLSGVRHNLSGTTANLLLNGTSIAEATATNDTVSSGGNSYSAIAVAKTINDKSGTTGVYADIQTTVVQLSNLTFSNYQGNLNTDKFQINDVLIAKSGIGSVNAFVLAVNEYSNQTGVKARLQSGSTDDVELYADDGRNIELTWTTQTLTNGTALFNAFTNASNVDANGLSMGVVFTTGVISVATNIIRTGAVKLRSSSAITIAGANVSVCLGFSTTAISVSSATALNSVVINSQDTATDALSVVDSVIRQLTDIRASLGGVQNRLEANVSNLSVSTENLAAAQSQIRDSDIAVETAEMTKSQILQQAGIAILSQANVSAQAALRLLQNQ